MLICKQILHSFCWFFLFSQNMNCNMTTCKNSHTSEQSEKLGQNFTQDSYAHCLSIHNNIIKNKLPCLRCVSKLARVYLRLKFQLHTYIFLGCKVQNFQSSMDAKFSYYVTFSYKYIQPDSSLKGQMKQTLLAYIVFITAKTFLQLFYLGIKSCFVSKKPHSFEGRFQHNRVLVPSTNQHYFYPTLWSSLLHQNWSHHHLSQWKETMPGPFHPNFKEKR